MIENINSLRVPELQLLIDKFAPFFAEVRKRIIFTLFVFVFASGAGFAFYEKIIKFLIDVFSLKGINIVFTSPFQFINLAIACGIATGLVLVFPLIMYQLFSFLKPALRKKEYRMINSFLPFSIILFLIGFLFGALIMRWQIQIFLASATSLGIGNILDISQLLTTVILTSTFLGAGFQFPVVLLLLLRAHLIKRSQLSSRRRWVYLASFIFAVLLPADSILADILLTLPLVVLFECTLVMDYFLAGKEIKNLKTK